MKKNFFSYPEKNVGIAYDTAEEIADFLICNQIPFREYAGTIWPLMLSMISVCGHDDDTYARLKEVRKLMIEANRELVI